jgi:hypothetical protein
MEGHVGAWAVIASEAKQSSRWIAKDWIASSQALLAKTGDHQNRIVIPTWLA